MWQLLECCFSSLCQSCIGVIQGCWMANTTLMTSYLFTLPTRRCRARAGSSKCEQHAFFGSFGNTTVKEIKLRELKDLLTDSPSVVCCPLGLHGCSMGDAVVSLYGVVCPVELLTPVRAHVSNRYGLIGRWQWLRNSLPYCVSCGASQP